MKECLTKSIDHRNGDVTAVCAKCEKRQRLPHYHWVRWTLGGDAVVLVCSECEAIRLEAATAAKKT